ncbi:hypothetical protein ACP70R_027308 [Stipagrostis hirtigluma subsp. patula]
MASSFLLSVLAWVVPILILLHYLMQIADIRHRRLPPGPWPLPLIGSVHKVSWSRAHRSLARLAERHGGLMTLWAGRFPTVVVSTPDAAREVLRNADLAGRTVLDAWRAEGHADHSVIVLPPRDKWRALRRFATAELFAQRRLDARQQLRHEKAQELVRDVAERAARGEAVDVGDVAFMAVINLMSRTLFSSDIGSHELRNMVKEATRLVAVPTVSDIFPAVAAADLQGARRRLGALIRHFHQIVDKQLTRRKLGREAGDPSKNDMLDVVIDKELEWKEDGNLMNYDAAKGLFTELFIAGTETVSSTVEWGMAELLRYPETMKKVKEELARVIGAKTQVEESDIGQLPYLQAVVKETLRLHPAVSLAFQRAMAAVQVQGYTIPKGTNIILNLWAINRNPETWVEPDRFMPERFIDSDISFWAYRMVKENGIDMTEKFGAVVSMETPLKAIAKECEG